jgi:hypothetical protein
LRCHFSHFDITGPPIAELAARPYCCHYFRRDVAAFIALAPPPITLADYAAVRFQEYAAPLFAEAELAFHIVSWPLRHCFCRFQFSSRHQKILPHSWPLFDIMANIFRIAIFTPFSLI